MKIIQILPELNAGGVERGTLELAAFLTAAGHDALVISNGGRLIAELECCGARHCTLPVHRKSLASLLQIRRLRQVLTAEKPDIVHLRSRVPGWLTWLAWRGMDPQFRPHLVSTVHGFYSVNRYSAIMTCGERVIAVSQSAKRYVTENYPNVPTSKLRVIPRGIQPDRYFPSYQPTTAWRTAWQTAHPHLANKRLLLLPGRITRLKGHEEFFALIAALTADHWPVHGLVVGDTHPKKRAYLAELHDLVRQLGISAHIDFLGHRNDLQDLMAISEIVFGLSRQPEAFGRTVLEALALGKPVIGYDCGGVGELLGELFPAGAIPPDDQETLLERTRELLIEPARPAPVGPPFTLDAMCRATLAVYQELVGTR